MQTEWVDRIGEREESVTQIRHKTDLTYCLRSWGNNGVADFLSFYPVGKQITELLHPSC